MDLAIGESINIAERNTFFRAMVIINSDRATGF